MHRRKPSEHRRKSRYRHLPEDPSSASCLDHLPEEPSSASCLDHLYSLAASLTAPFARCYCQASAESGSAPEARRAEEAKPSRARHKSADVDSLRILRVTYYITRFMDGLLRRPPERSSSFAVGDTNVGIIPSAWHLSAPKRTGALTCHAPLICIPSPRFTAS